MARSKTKRLTVRLDRDAEGWWVAKVLGVQGVHTQGRSLAQVRERLREVMELNDLPADADLTFEIHTGTKLDAKLERAREMRREAERLSKEVAETTQALAIELDKAGISRRDVGELVGVSFQRVQQLVSAE